MYSQDPINLLQKLSLFTEQWSPRTVASMNDLAIMVVRVDGEFTWHNHPDTDDFFLVLEGELEIGLREPDANGNLVERVVTLKPLELFIVPKGIYHCPAARKGEVKIMVMELQGTPNTGDTSTAAAYHEV